MPITTAKGLIFIKDSEGSDLKGSREDGSSTVLSFNFLANLPHDTGGRIRGVREVHPFSVVKEIDQLTPLLFKGLVKAELFQEIVIKLFRIDPETGLENNYFTFTFNNCHIVSISNSKSSIGDDKNEIIGQFETISFISEKIKMVFNEGNIEAIDEPALHLQK
jgi:type VI secretion system secreted protein Hcp